MAHKFAEIAFTDAVKSVQHEMGSRAACARREIGPDSNDRLGADEEAFIAERDSFYMATVSETGWPYIQHRGGPRGFLRVLDEKTIGFADFAGNRQYISVGNVTGDDRVSLFLMDYPKRARLKLLGRAKVVDATNPELARLVVARTKARIERAFLIKVEGFDWNCPQHITPRFSVDEVELFAAPLKARLAELEAKLSISLGG